MFDRWLDSTRWWWCALSGLLLVASFAPFSCATCGWIALAPAWWVVSRSESARRQPIRHGYLIGLIYFGGTFWWISNVTAIGTFFLVLYLALYPAVWFYLVTRFVLPRARKPDGLGGNGMAPIAEALGAAALWVTLEWWRSWFLTGFNWNELGISQAPSFVFRQLAVYGGVHLISLVLVTVNILWAEGLLGIIQTLRERRVVRVSMPFGAGLLIVAAGFAMGSMNMHGNRTPIANVSFACIQPNIPQIPYDSSKPYVDFEKTENDALERTKQLSLTAMAAGDKPQLLIWPEAMIDEGVFNDRPLNEAVRDICQAYDGWFLLGSQDFDMHSRKIYNAAYFFGPGGDQFQEYRKTRLVILGEFLPFGDTFPWLRKLAGVGMDFTPGPGPMKFVMTKPATSFAPLICFEDTLPEVADKAVKLGPDFFITITNDGWYTGWFAAWGVRQHLNHAIFRCIEHDRPMIRCANTGISCVIDPYGSVVERYRGESGAEIDVGGIFRGTLPLDPAHRTPYEKWGDWIVLISRVVSAMLGIRFFARPRP